MFLIMLFSFIQYKSYYVITILRIWIYLHLDVICIADRRHKYLLELWKIFSSLATCFDKKSHHKARFANVTRQTFSSHN
jgi:hypothetical protein